MTRRAAALFSLVVVAGIVIVAWVSRVSDGKKSLDACDASLKRGDRIEAIVFARAAAESRCPLCSSSEAGYQRLQTIAKEAEGRGEDTTAVAAWRAVRAATLSSVVLDAQGGARRTHADEEIARLEHRIDLAAAAGGGSATSPAASEERLRAMLQASAVPSTMVFLLLAAGGVLFVAGAYRLVRTRSPTASSMSLPDLITAVLGIGVALAGLLLF